MWHRLYVHLVWTTFGRARSLGLDTASFLATFAPAVCHQERAALLALGAVRSHVHLLVRLHPTTDLPRLVQRLKGGSSVMAKRERRAPTTLKWAKGYSATSIGPRALDAAKRYVLRQGQHHPHEAIDGWNGWEPESVIVELGANSEPGEIAESGSPSESGGLGGLGASGAPGEQARRSACR